MRFNLYHLGFIYYLKILYLPNNIATTYYHLDLHKKYVSEVFCLFVEDILCWNYYNELDLISQDVNCLFFFVPD